MPVQDPDRTHIWCDQHKAAIVADMYFENVVKCMAEAQCRIEELTLDQLTLHDRTTWKETIKLQQLDLSGLQRLTVEPTSRHFDPYDHMHMNVDEDGFHAVMGRIMQKDLDLLLTESRDTLEVFSSRRACIFTWTGTPIALPNLHTLSLGICEMESQFFVSWLSKLPKLAEITLWKFSIGDLLLAPEGLEEWKKIFDAIRDHKTLKRGEISMELRDELFVWEFEDGLEFRFDKDAGMDEVDLEIIAQANVDLDSSQHGLGEWIRLYVCGRIEWTGMLRHYLTDL